MSGYTAIDLTRLPAPDVLDLLDYELILEELLDDVRKRWPDFDALLESDPAMKVLEVAAYREVLLRQRVNDAAKACMLAYAKRADLDNLAGLLGVTRNTIDPGDPDALPPVPATMESDDSLRSRAPLSLEGQTTAGSSGSYVFHGLSVAGVKDIAVDTPEPGRVDVTVLGLDADGVPSAELLSAVEATLSADDVRPFTDFVNVQPAAVVEYAIEATLYTYSGPDPAVVLEAAKAEAEQVTEEAHRLGRALPLSALYAALHREGVQRVELASPAADIAVTAGQAPWCTGLTVNHGGVVNG